MPAPINIPKEEILELYNLKKSIHQIGKIKKVSDNTVKRWYNTLGLISDPIEDYFENIDSFTKAYFVGLLFADGNTCVTKATNGGLRYGVRINLKHTDGYLLQKLSNEITPYRDPYRVKYKAESSQDQLVWSLTSKKMFDDLRTLGFTNRKSYDLNLSLPVVNSNLHSHLVRGLFDGDGSVYQGRIDISMPNPNVIYELDRMIFLHTGVKGRISLRFPEEKYKRSLIMYRLQYKKSIVSPVVRWMYKDCSVCLLRKRDRFSIEDYSFANTVLT